MNNNNYEYLQTNYNTYMIQKDEIIGTGAISEVFLGRRQRDSLQIAIKILREKTILGEQKNLYFDKEYEVSKKIMNLQQQEPNCNILNIIDVLEGYSNIITSQSQQINESTNINISTNFNSQQNQKPEKVKYVITEFCNNNSLYTYMQKKSYKFTENEVIEISIQIANGIYYLHKNDLMHRDLKPENIFVHSIYDQQGNSKQIFKLGDFGLVKSTAENGLFPSVVGTINYMSPDILNQQKYNKEVDFWSFGCIMHELYDGEQKFTDQTYHGVIQKIKSYQNKIEGTQDQNSIYDIVLKCLNRDSNKRYQTALEIKDDLIKLQQKNNLSNQRQYSPNVKANVQVQNYIECPIQNQNQFNNNSTAQFTSVYQNAFNQDPSINNDSLQIKSPVSFIKTSEYHLQNGEMTFRHQQLKNQSQLSEESKNNQSLIQNNFSDEVFNMSNVKTNQPPNNHIHQIYTNHNFNQQDSENYLPQFGGQSQISYDYNLSTKPNSFEYKFNIDQSLQNKDLSVYIQNNNEQQNISFQQSENKKSNHTININDRNDNLNKNSEQNNQNSSKNQEILAQQRFPDNRIPIKISISNKKFYRSKSQKSTENIQKPFNDINQYKKKQIAEDDSIISSKVKNSQQLSNYYNQSDFYNQTNQKDYTNLCNTRQNFMQEINNKSQNNQFEQNQQIQNNSNLKSIKSESMNDQELNNQNQTLAFDGSNTWNISQYQKNNLNSKLNQSREIQSEQIKNSKELPNNVKQIINASNNNLQNDMRYSIISGKTSQLQNQQTQQEYNQIFINSEKVFNNKIQQELQQISQKPIQQNLNMNKMQQRNQEIQEIMAKTKKQQQKQDESNKSIKKQEEKKQFSTQSDKQQYQDLKSWKKSNQSQVTYSPQNQNTKLNKSQHNTNQSNSQITNMILQKQFQ